jgi:hypothetical protein
MEMDEAMHVRYHSLSTEAKTSILKKYNRYSSKKHRILKISYALDIRAVLVCTYQKQCMMRD